MKTTEKSLQQRKASDVRQTEIVEAAIRIIAAEGPRNFTAKRVADEVGITSGAIFRHFESMASIIDKAVDRIGVVLGKDFPESTEEPFEDLRVFFFNRTSTIAAHPHISRLLLSDHLAQAAGSQTGDRLGQFKRRTREFVVQCLSEAQNAGDLADGVSINAAALVVLGAVLALSHTGTRVVRVAEAERLAEDVWTTMQRMFQTRLHDPKSIR